MPIEFLGAEEWPCDVEQTSAREPLPLQDLPTEPPLPEQDWLDTNWDETFGEALDSRSSTLDPRPSPSLSDPLLRLFLRDALREPPVTDEEEKSLVWSARFGDAPARERLVLGHLRLVAHWAFRYQGHGLDVADLIAEGSQGLLHAAEKYDALAGTRFATCASWWIRQRITRALDNQARTVRRPANYNQLRRQLAAAQAELETKLSRPPEAAELAQACRLRPATVRQVLADVPEISLDAPACPQANRSFGEQLADDQTLPPDAVMMQRENSAGLAQLLQSLSAREQQVLALRFGLDDGIERTLEEVGRELGLLRQRVHQIASQALKRLRTRWPAGA